MIKDKKKIAIVTGGSSGIGQAVCKRLTKSGYKVYELSRRQIDGDVEDIIHYPADVADEEKIIDIVKSIYDKEKRIDLAVNCAGYGISGASEFTEKKDAARQLEVNVLGTANVCKAVIPYMRKKRSGRIINISSVAAIMPIPFQTWYSASKAAINSYSCALANELKPFRIGVSAIMLGDCKTGFTSARDKSIKGDEIYRGRISRSVKKMEEDEQSGCSPDEVAEYILKVISKKNIKPLYIMGKSYKLVGVLDRIMPIGFKNALLYRFYGR